MQVHGRTHLGRNSDVFWKGYFLSVDAETSMAAFQAPSLQGFLQRAG
jgi:hypothetical protein